MTEILAKLLLTNIVLVAGLLLSGGIMHEIYKDVKDIPDNAVLVWGVVAVYVAVSSVIYIIAMIWV